MISETQLSELKNILPSARNILIALPRGANIDRLSSALALFLSLNAQNKEVSIVSEDTLIVGQAHLFGIDHIQKTLSQISGGNLTLSLENVASNGTVPSLEKLDWSVEGNNLNLVFHVMPGQTFQPARIVPKYQGGGYNLIFTVGALSLNSLGNIYNQNQQVFSGTHLVNLDNQVHNSGFGQTNLVDANSTISEITLFLINSLNLPLDGDIATNLLAGIYDGTKDLVDPRVSADTFTAAASCMRAGGKKPQGFGTPVGQGLDLSALIPQAALQTDASGTPAPLGKEAISEAFIVPPVVSESVSVQSEQPSPEERPMGEGLSSAESIEPEPGWLTPKVFSGKSIG